MHPSHLSDDLIRQANTIAYAHHRELPLGDGVWPVLIFMSPAKVEMNPGIERGHSYDLEIDSWDQLHQARAKILAVRGENGIVGRDERRDMLESLEPSGRERVYKQRLNLEPDAKVTLPPKWIDRVLDVEYGPEA